MLRVAMYMHINRTRVPREIAVAGATRPFRPSATAGPTSAVAWAGAPGASASRGHQAANVGPFRAYRPQPGRPGLAARPARSQAVVCQAGLRAQRQPGQPVPLARLGPGGGHRATGPRRPDRPDDTVIQVRVTRAQTGLASARLPSPPQPDRGWLCFQSCRLGRTAKSVLVQRPPPARRRAGRAHRTTADRVDTARSVDVRSLSPARTGIVRLPPE